MGEIIRLGAEEGQPGLHLKVDPLGAVVTCLSLNRQDILYPRREIAMPGGLVTKRGGLHACSPYFGPDPEGIGPQHGFARDEQWEIMDLDKDSIRLELSGVEGWSHLEQTIVYGVNPNLQVFWASLRLMKMGDLTRMVSPGFHPYFNRLAEAKAWTSGMTTEKRNEAPVRGKGKKLETPLRLSTNPGAPDINVIMGGVGTQKRVYWTDDPGYGCVEPVADARDLQPGGSMTISMTIQATLAN